MLDQNPDNASRAAMRGPESNAAIVCAAADAFPGPTTGESGEITTGWALDVLANSDDAVVAIDQRGRVMWFNLGAERMFAYSAADVIGRDLSMLMPERFAESDGRWPESTANRSRR